MRRRGFSSTGSHQGTPKLAVQQGVQVARPANHRRRRRDTGRLHGNRPSQTQIGEAVAQFVAKPTRFHPKVPQNPTHWYPFNVQTLSQWKTLASCSLCSLAGKPRAWIRRVQTKTSKWGRKSTWSDWLHWPSCKNQYDTILHSFLEENQKHPTSGEISQPKSCVGRNPQIPQITGSWEGLKWICLEHLWTKSLLRSPQIFRISKDLSNPALCSLLLTIINSLLAIKMAQSTKVCCTSKPWHHTKRCEKLGIRLAALIVLQAEFIRLNASWPRNCNERVF